MARRLRIEYEGAMYHVINRGNYRGDVFRTEGALQACLTRPGKTAHDIASDRKAAAWKVAVAAHLKQHSSAKNPWLAEALRMGAPAGVSRYVAELKHGRREPAAALKASIANIMV